MKTELPLRDWNRREHFAFFSAFEEPFFGLVTNVDVTLAYQKARAQGWSFYFYYLHQSLTAANQIEPFRYRIENGKIYLHDLIHASATVLRDDHTFGFSFYEYEPDFAGFARRAATETARVKVAAGLCLTDQATRPDVIHYSAMPWVSFTGLTHARAFAHPDSVPKISFGKFLRQDNKILLPVAINVHHGLMDGYHVGEYLTVFQQLLNEK